MNMDTPDAATLKREIIRLNEEIATLRLYINTHLNRYTVLIAEQYQDIRGLAPYARYFKKKLKAQSGDKNS